MPHLSIGQMATLRLFSSQGGTAQITGRLRANLLHVDRPIKKIDGVDTTTVDLAPGESPPTPERPSPTPATGDPSNWPQATQRISKGEDHDSYRRAPQQPASETARFVEIVSERQDVFDEQLGKVMDTIAIIQKHLSQQVTWAPQTSFHIQSGTNPVTLTPDWQAKGQGPHFSITTTGNHKGSDSTERAGTAAGSQGYQYLMATTTPEMQRNAIANQVDLQIQKVPNLPFDRNSGDIKAIPLASKYNPSLSQNKGQTALTFLKELEREALTSHYRWPEYLSHIQSGAWITCPIKRHIWKAAMSSDATLPLFQSTPCDTEDALEIYGQLLLWIGFTFDTAGGQQALLDQIANMELAEPKLSALVPYVQNLIELHKQINLPNWPEDQSVVQIKTLTEAKITSTFLAGKYENSAKQILEEVNRQLRKLDDQAQQQTRTKSLPYSNTLSISARDRLTRYDMQATIDPRTNATAAYLKAVTKAVEQLTHAMPHTDGPTVMANTDPDPCWSNRRSLESHTTAYDVDDMARPDQDDHWNEPAQSPVRVDAHYGDINIPYGPSRNREPTCPLCGEYKHDPDPCTYVNSTPMGLTVNRSKFAAMSSQQAYSKLQWMRRRSPVLQYVREDDFQNLIEGVERLRRQERHLANDGTRSQEAATPTPRPIPSQLRESQDARMSR